MFQSIMTILAQYSGVERGIFWQYDNNVHTLSQITPFTHLIAYH